MRMIAATLTFGILGGAVGASVRRAHLQKEAAESGCFYVAVPQADISNGIGSAANPFLEGGDVLVYGKTVFVGNSRRASNHEGIV